MTFIQNVTVDWLGNMTIITTNVRNALKLRLVSTQIARVLIQIWCSLIPEMHVKAVLQIVWGKYQTVRATMELVCIEHFGLLTFVYSINVNFVQRIQRIWKLLSTMPIRSIG